MDPKESFGNLIPDPLNKKLQQEGVPFSELRQASNVPEKLVEQIYRLWRSGTLRIERNWNGILDQPSNIPYSNSACLLPDDRLYLGTSSLLHCWKIATWNVNSIRTRLPLILQWLKEHNPDVVCLQETKVEDAQFPVWELQQAGYESVFSGQKSYNGVAILSKHPIRDEQRGFRNGYDPENARLIAATVSGVRIVNVYVPQGQTTESEKFQYKLNFFAELIQEIRKYRKSESAFAIMGDFNIAPTAEDLSDPASMRNKVSFHPEEHALLAELKEIELSDLFRKFDQRSGQFSWWDFRTRGFERDAGMRIDYILANSVLTSSCQACIIDTEARAQDRPSDHAPVIAEFNL
jgi:exodeoxyribonuclease-3|tara:strand:+ start:351 stop:1397 length:1047 start_codon:yes stop_codon:yes gene_type:complete